MDQIVHYILDNTLRSLLLARLGPGLHTKDISHPSAKITRLQRVPSGPYYQIECKESTN